MRLDYSIYLEIAGRYLQLLCFASFVIGCFHLWRITCRISLGFELIGRIVTMVQFSALLLMAFGPGRITLFRIIVYGSLSTWLFYTTWYFSRYPIPSEYLKSDRVPSLPGHPVYMPKMALLRYLVGRSPALDEPWWHGRTFRTFGGVAVGFLFLIYGFVQTINGYSWAYAYSAMVQQKTGEQLQQAVERSTAPLFGKVDSLKQGQQDLAEKIDSGVTVNGPAVLIPVPQVKRNPQKRGRVRYNVSPIGPRVLPETSLPAEVDTARVKSPRTRLQQLLDRIFSGPDGRPDSLRLASTVSRVK